MSEMVAINCPSGCGFCSCGKARVVKKTWAVAHDRPYKLLSSQPLTRKERAEEARLRAQPLRESGTGPYVSTPHLSIEDQKSLSLQSGRQITDKDDLRRYHQEAGTRSMEKGERAEVMRRDMKEWAAAGGSASGIPLPESCRTERPVSNRVDIRRIYEEIRGQYGN